MKTHATERQPIWYEITLLVDWDGKYMRSLHYPIQDGDTLNVIPMDTDISSCTAYEIT